MPIWRYQKEPLRIQPYKRACVQIKDCEKQQIQNLREINVVKINKS